MAWLKKYIVDDWRDAWRWFSVQVNAVLAVLVALFVDYADIALGLAGVVLHGPARLALIVAVGIMWLLVSVVPRIIKQKESGDVAA